jgi:hypothetical protein
MEPQDGEQQRIVTLDFTGSVRSLESLSYQWTLPSNDSEISDVTLSFDLESPSTLSLEAGKLVYQAVQCLNSLFGTNNGQLAKCSFLSTIKEST